MKKLILVLVILLAVPALALNLTLTRETPDGNKVDIGYAGADAGNLPRAFALNVVIDSPATITALSGYKVGESNSTSKGYGIYPARIDINSTTGAVSSWGTPLADPNDPGTSGSGLGTQKVVLEFGSLYPAGDGNKAPAISGTLATLTLGLPGSGTINVAASEEDTYRGGVVLENGATPDPNLTASLAIVLAPPDCFSGSDPAYAQWVSQGKPKSWCCLHQRDGDADGDGAKNAADLIILKLCYGKAYANHNGYDCRADFTHDGFDNAADLIALKVGYGTNYGTPCQNDWKSDCGSNP